MELKARLILKVLAFVSAIIASSEERVTGQIVVDYMILSLDDHSWNSSTHESRRGVDEGRERRKKEGGWRGEGEDGEREGEKVVADNTDRQQVADRGSRQHHA